MEHALSKHMDTLSEEIAAITRQLATDQTVPKEMVGERVLKVALAMLKRPRPEVGEIDPLIWASFTNMRGTLAAAGEAVGNETPHELELRLHNYVRKVSNEARDARVDKEPSSVLGLIRDLLVEHKAASGREDPREVEAALRNLLVSKDQRISELDAMAYDVSQERDTAVKLLNDMLRGFVTAKEATDVEINAQQWLADKGWANYQPKPPAGR